MVKTNVNTLICYEPGKEIHHQKKLSENTTDSAYTHFVPISNYGNPNQQPLWVSSRVIDAPPVHNTLGLHCVLYWVCLFVLKLALEQFSETLRPGQYTSPHFCLSRPNIITIMVPDAINSWDHDLAKE